MSITTCLLVFLLLTDSLLWAHWVGYLPGLVWAVAAGGVVVGYRWLEREGRPLDKQRRIG